MTYISTKIMICTIRWNRLSVFKALDDHSSALFLLASLMIQLKKSRISLRLFGSIRMGIMLSICMV